MPTIPTYFRQVSPSGVARVDSTVGRALNTNADVTAFGGGAGARALAQGLDAFAGGADALAAAGTREAERQRQQDIANVVARSRDADIAEEVRKSVPADGAGYAEALRQRLDDHSVELLAQLPDDDDTGRAFDAYRTEVVSRRYQQAVADEIQIKQAYSLDQANESLRVLQNKLIANPNDADLIMEQGRAVIGALPGLDQGTLERMQRSFARDAEATKFRGLLSAAKSSGAVAAVEARLKGAEGQALASEDLERLLRSAEQTRKGLATQSRSQSVSAVDVVERANAEGRVASGEEVAEALRLAKASGDPKIVEAAARAAAHRTLVVELRAVPLSAQLDMIATLQDREAAGDLSEQGRTELELRARTVQSLAKLAESDTVRFVAQSGAEIAPVLTGPADKRTISPEALRDRFATMERAAAKHGFDPAGGTVFTPQERAQISAVLRADPSTYPVMLEALDGSAPSVKAAAIRQLGLSDAGTAVPLLAAANGRPDVAQEAVAGLPIAEDAARRKAFGVTAEAAETALATTPGMFIPLGREQEREALLKGATQVYLARSASVGRTEFDPAEFQRAALDLQGLRQDRVNGVDVALPPGVDGETVEDALDLFTAEDWAKLTPPNWGGPTTAIGDPLTAEQLSLDAVPVSVGGGLFGLRLRDGTFALSRNSVTGSVAPLVVRLDPDRLTEILTTSRAAAEQRFRDKQPQTVVTP